MLTDNAKTNVWWARYEPFGRVHATGGTLTQNLGLPGQWFQLENGLAYNWHRHYDPTTGRYTTADPLGFVDGPSLYAYARSNPQRFVDPSGQFVPVLVGAGAAAAYIFTPNVANAPGPDDTVYPNNDLDPFVNAASFGIGLGLGAGYATGPEFVVRACRIAPFGNRTGHPTGRFPHYHYGRPHQNPKRAAKGENARDQGRDRHRPWDKGATDKSWGDRWR
jgi:RHS repeat-associated protein